MPPPKAGNYGKTVQRAGPSCCSCISYSHVSFSLSGLCSVPTSRVDFRLVASGGRGIYVRIAVAVELADSSFGKNIRLPGQDYNRLTVILQSGTRRLVALFVQQAHYCLETLRVRSLWTTLH